MPSLSDAPTLDTLSAVEFDDANAGTATSLATQDLVLVYDMSQRKIKAITVADFAASINDETIETTSGSD